ncbi:Uncharacterised protein (plasmid) [Tsukamurella tyrosinosolvens]|uniref:PcfJ-like protein n=1 Tax=Tsukamurella tyrosinosolvens TaxID=57704 RepID=A0A1H4ULD9_TSUTY|nr:hypothetical protein [Tsukamurella tyrosinosolvens]KXO99045.1 hypothetical protein AXK58_24125 [Tsukamurella tyrosinosolvens]SEC68944.1 hypothetical protein SAMN04489793_2927 [Tsukamurella tyrosinosolvens]VEH94276.1 Uncharacterised protein [Tsukamurella tyrosinosolvens]
MLIRRSTGGVYTQCDRLWDDGSLNAHQAIDRRGVPLSGVPRTESEELRDRINDLLGPRPRLCERFPLLASSDSDGFTANLDVISNAQAFVQDPWLDARDARQVAQNLFGRRAYRKPLAREVVRHGAGMLSWFSLYRGLVDPERILEALGSIPREHTEVYLRAASSEMRTVRQILVRTPASVLRRVIAAPYGQHQHALLDAARAVRSRKELRIDLERLPALIEARGARNVRTPGDLHDLVLALRLDQPKSLLWTPRRVAAAEARLKEREASQMLEEFNYDRQLRGLPVIDWETWRTDPTLLEAAMADQAARAERLRIESERQKAEREVRAEQLRLEQRRRDAAAITAAQHLKAQLNDLEPAAFAGMRLEIAASGEQLREWGAAMGNCIGTYTQELERSVLFALHSPVAGRQEKILLNGHIRVCADEAGHPVFELTQLLGRSNRPALECVGLEGVRTVLEALLGVGVRRATHTWGLEGVTAQAA